MNLCGKATKRVVTCPKIVSAILQNNDEEQEASLSMSSTFLVHSSNCTDKKMIVSSPTKIVRFDESRVVYYSNIWEKDDSSEQCSWFQSADYQQFRQDTSEAIQQFRDSDAHAQLEQDCGTADDSQASYANLLEQVYNASCVINSNKNKSPNNDHDGEDDEVLLKSLRIMEDDSGMCHCWHTCINAHVDRWGLEYATLPSLGRTRRERRRRLYKRVARLQTMVPACHPSRDAVLRKMCQESSRPSRVFAHLLAQGASSL